MSSPAILAAAPPPPTRTLPFLTTTSQSIRSIYHRRRSNPLQRIRSTAPESTATVAGPAVESTPEEEAKVGARVRVTVPLKVYHIPKVTELDLNGKEGKVKEYVAVWRGKHISANLPYKIEFFEVIEGRGDAPVKFVAHLKDDEFEYID